MCFCLPTAVEVDTIDRTPYGPRVVRKTTYGLHTPTSDSSSFSSTEKPRRRWGSKTDYFDHEPYPSYNQHQLAYPLALPPPQQTTTTHRTPLMIEAPPMPVLQHHQPAVQSYNVVEASPYTHHQTIPTAPYPLRHHDGGVIYDAEPELYEEGYTTGPRASMPRRFSTSRRNSGVRYGRGSFRDNDLDTDYHRDSREYVGAGNGLGLRSRGVRFS